MRNLRRIQTAKNGLDLIGYFLFEKILDNNEKGVIIIVN